MEGEEKKGVVPGDTSASVVHLASLPSVGHTDIPISEIEPRLRLGALIRRARSKANVRLEDIAELIGSDSGFVMQVENGNLPLAARALQQIADRTKCDYQELLDAARDFQKSLFDANPPRLVGGDITGTARTIAMPPEQVFVEYREGWFAGASGRPDPGDMSPAWGSGHEDGRVAMETAFHAKRVELDTHYGDGERGAPTP